MNWKRSEAPIRLFAAGVLAIAAADAAAEEPAATLEAKVALNFAPRTVTIRAGKTIEWRNTSQVRHTVTAVPDKAADPADVHLPEGAQPFNSGWLDAGETYSHTFKLPGSYTYFCIPHEVAEMVGQVIVQPAE